MMKFSLNVCGTHLIGIVHVNKGRALVNDIGASPFY